MAETLASGGAGSEGPKSSAGSVSASGFIGGGRILGSESVETVPDSDHTTSGEVPTMPAVGPAPTPAAASMPAPPPVTAPRGSAPITMALRVPPETNPRGVPPVTAPRGAMTAPRGGAGHAATSTGPQPAQMPPAPKLAAAWGTLVSVNRDGTDGTRYALSGDWIDIGRSDADITFLDDKFLSERHARFEVKQGNAFVVPLDSMNGVFHKISRRTELAHGSRVLLGRELLKLELLEDGEREAPSLVRHGVSMFGSPVRRSWGRLMQLIPNGGVRDVRHLAAEVTTVGREEGDILFRDDEFLSRRHAAFKWQGGKCILEDLNSSNGTFVRITKPLRLSRGDQLRFGDQMFRFEPADG